MSMDGQYRLFQEENLPMENKPVNESSTTTTPTMKGIQDREIDISDVFAGIKKFFVNIYSGIGYGLLSTIYFIKHHRKLIGTVMALGMGAGLIYSLGGKPFYSSSMAVKSSDSYLEKNIITKVLDELNTMCEEEDFEELANILNITPGQAQSLRGFELEEEKEVSNLGSYYSKYFKVLSTVPDEEKREELLATFIESEKENIYYISVSVYDATVLPLLNEPLAKLINTNPYFVRKRGINEVALRASEEKIYNELSKLDSLKQTLTRAIENNDKNMKSGSNNIFLGESQLYNPLPVYEKYLGLYSDAIAIKKQLFFNENTVEILSGFVKLKKNVRLSPLLSSLAGAGVGLVGGIGLAIFLIAFRNFNELEMPRKPE